MKNEDTRSIGTNWDDVKVAARVDEDRGAIARKVITQGVTQIEAGEIISRAFQGLRQGWEVRFVDEIGEDALRLYPCVSRDGETMDVCARTMNGFKATLRDKKVRKTPLGKRAEEKPKAEGEGEGGGEGGEGEGEAGITPDPIVTCPQCHKRFRVGRKS